MKDAHEKMPTFNFIPLCGDHSFRVHYSYKPETPQENWLCCVSHNPHVNQWRIDNVWPENFLPVLRNMRFDSKEQSAEFCYSLISHVESQTKNCPLPSDLVQYLNDKATELQKKNDQLLQDFHAITRERYYLNQVAERNQILRLEYLTRETNQQKVVNDLLEFNISGSDVPFFSEVSLYELIGKEDARTVLALVKQVCNLLAPDVVQEKGL